MYVCMMEYRVKEECRDEYLAWVEEVGRLEPQPLLYEGTDQQGLFVEIWPAESEEAAHRIQDAARAGEAPWSKLPLWVNGKINAWSFCQINAKI